MKRRVEVGGESYLLDLQMNASNAAYTLRGVSNFSGHASIEETSPGVFSILLNDRSFLLHLFPRAEGVEVWIDSHRFIISLADPRDKAAASKKSKATGPVEVRAHMPGKIIKLLADKDASVKLGQGLLVVEAMKMQNEVKSPKDGIIAKVHAAEGATVAAGDLLMVVV